MDREQILMNDLARMVGLFGRGWPEVPVQFDDDDVRTMPLPEEQGEFVKDMRAKLERLGKTPIPFES